MKLLITILSLTFASSAFANTPTFHCQMDVQIGNAIGAIPPIKMDITPVNHASPGLRYDKDANNIYSAQLRKGFGKWVYELVIDALQTSSETTPGGSHVMNLIAESVSEFDGKSIRGSVFVNTGGVNQGDTIYVKCIAP